MNSKRIHDNIILNAQNRNWTRKSAPCYVELHHIIPKSFRGRDIKENLVFLTAKEHYIIHLLLTKIYDKGMQHDKMIRAFIRMCKGNSVYEKVVKSRTYEKLRTEYALVVSRQVTGKNHPMFGKKHTDETKEKMRLLRFERIDKGVLEGNRKPHSDEAKEKMRSAKLGKILTEEHKKKIGHTNLGRKFSEESRNNMRKAAINRWKNQNTLVS